MSSEIEPVPPPVWGSPLQYTPAAGGHVIRAEAPGFFRSPPAVRLLLLGALFIAAGLFVIGGAAIGSLREFEIGSIFAFLIGGSVGALIAWLGITGIRWAVAAAWGVTEITITPEALRVTRTCPSKWEAEVSRADFRSTMITDQFRLANELLVMMRGHRIIRVLSGRSTAELGWLADRIESCLSDEFEPDAA